MKRSRSSGMTNYMADRYGGWNVANVKCCNCGYKWVACFPDGTKIKELQCKMCGQQGMTESEDKNEL